MYLYFSIPATHIKNRSYLLLTTCYACYVVIKQYVMLQCVGEITTCYSCRSCYVILCYVAKYVLPATQCSRVKPCLSVIKQGASPAGGQCNGDVAMDIGKMDNWTEWIMDEMNGYWNNGYVCNMCTKQGKAMVPKKGDGLVFYHTLCPLCSLSLFSLLHKHVSFFPFLSPLSG